MNPLFDLSCKDEAMAFDKIKVEHFLPALTKAIENGRKEILAIKECTHDPDFENTIVELEHSSDDVERVVTAFSNLESVIGDEAYHKLAEQIYPLATAFSSDILLDELLFKKIQTVKDSAPSKLTPEQTTLLNRTYQNFVRNGALLSNEKKGRLRQIDQEMATLSPKFSENVLKATNSFELWISEVADLEGLPDSAREAAHASATAKGQPSKWLFTLQAPSYIPFMTYSKNRALRDKLWRAYNSRSFGDKFDNQENIKQIVKLRSERANLLGFANHSEFVLADRMAKNTTTVFDFLNNLLTPVKKAAQEDLRELQNFSTSCGGPNPIMTWDWAYYSEKLRENKYSFNEEDIRPYFKLENVVNGLFEITEKLYNIKLVESKEYPLYHSEVRTFEVHEANSNKYLGILYIDLFPRETKKGGAWMTSYRDQGVFRDKLRRPHVSIVCNFTKPTPTKPSLLTFNEVKTLFHEFGHALHTLLSKVTYRSLSGPNVLWDFVELPSQILENWVDEKESLDLIARHYESNAPLPKELFDKLTRARRFQAGYVSLRQIQFSLLDMSWHTSSLDKISEVPAFEASVLSETRLLPLIENSNISCGFSHIFAGGYSSGYYSYKWAEVLDADAFELFKLKGLFDSETAKSFKENILEKGGTEDPMVLYKRFRGRSPDVAALLRRDGLSS